MDPWNSAPLAAFSQPRSVKVWPLPASWQKKVRLLLDPAKHFIRSWDTFSQKPPSPPPLVEAENHLLT